jgi:tetratricopeptide (TPR) repeat protein
MGFFVLGSAAFAQKAYAEAERRWGEGLAVCQEAGKRDGIGWAHALLAYVAREQGQPSLARQHLYEALRIGTEIGAFMPLITALPAKALLLADRGERARAVELYALASRYPFVGRSRWFEDVAGRELSAVGEALPPEVVTAAEERGRARDLWATAEELLIELEGWQAVDA